MVKIRLARVGRRNSPFYRLVVADNRKARDGRFIEILGIYQPLAAETRLKIDEARALNWLDKGAVPSDTVRSLLRREGILKKFHDSRQKPQKQTAPEA